jgi:hypothetical protein
MASTSGLQSAKREDTAASNHAHRHLPCGRKPKLLSPQSPCQGLSNYLRLPTPNSKEPKMLAPDPCQNGGSPQTWPLPWKSVLPRSCLSGRLHDLLRPARPASALEGAVSRGDAGSFPGPDWMPKQAHMANLQAAAARNLVASLRGERAKARFKTELICIVDALDPGMLAARIEKRSLILPPSRAPHWAQRQRGAMQAKAIEQWVSQRLSQA